MLRDILNVVSVLTLVVVMAAASPLQTVPDPPREISTDALAYLLDVEATLAENGHSVVGSLVRGPGTSATWELDGREIPPSELGGVRVEGVHVARIDTAGTVAIRLATEPAAEPATVQEVEIRVIPSEPAVAERMMRQDSTLLLLGSVLVTGDDVSAIGERRHMLEQSMEEVDVFSPESVSRHLGAEVSFTFVRAALTVDPRLYLFGEASR